VGLSVAQVLKVDGRMLILGGADIVDGSPVLDIKPYIPFCDSVPQALAPAWVSRRRPVECLTLTDWSYVKGEGHAWVER